VRSELTVHLIKRIDQVLPLVLEPPISPPPQAQPEGEYEAQL
jgi:hypothetical protein